MRVTKPPLATSLTPMSALQAGGRLLPPEKQLFLSGIAAPRRDEPHALGSRDWLRQQIGRPCVFHVDGNQGGREVATVFVGSSNLALASLAQGWSRVRGEAPPDSPAAKAQLEAQAARLGVWGAASAVAPPPTAANPATLTPNVPISAVVEAALNGSLLRCTLVVSNQYVTANLAGVQCPSMNRKAASEADGQTPPQPEPFAREAKHHTEMHVLHRPVQLVPRGLDKYSNLMCSISFDSNDTHGVDLAEDLLKAGLGRIADWSISLCDAASRLRSAESQAMQARRGLWHNHVMAAPSTMGRFAGRVVEVVSGDVLVVADACTGAERRVGLASIRAPRVGNVRKGEAPNAAGLAAKEFLRTSLIGRTVVVQLEYIRTLGSTGEEGATPSVDEPQRTLEMASLYEEKLDARGAVVARRSVGELLVANGLASVTRHKPGEPRAERYDALLAAEEQARSARRGVHSGTDLPAPATLHDLSRDPGRARAYHSTLLRAGRLNAVVEYIISPGRLKLSIPKAGVQILFTMAGVRCPRASDPGAAEAIAFLRKHVLQREVGVNIETVSVKTGLFMGGLSYPSLPGGAPTANLAMDMVQAGLAFVHNTSDGRAESHDLRAAETSARDKRLGLWAHHVDDEASGQDHADDDAQGGSECVAVAVGDVRSGALFYIQRRGDIADIEERIAQKGVPPVGGFAPAVGALCLAQFSVDDRWYRARVVRKLAHDMFQVLFVDYGNEEALPPARLAALDADLAAAPAAAQPARLAWLFVPTLEHDCGVEAAQLLSSLTAGGRALAARIESRDRASGVVDVTLTPADGTDAESLNVAMLSEGLARISKRAASTARGRCAAEELRPHQERARKLHKGMFVYGDVDSDEEE